MIEAARTPVGVDHHLRRISTPIGRIEIVGSTDAVTRVAIEDHGSLPWAHLPERPSPAVDDAARQILEYASGTRRVIDVETDVVGTPFQRAVWSALSAIAWGEIASYGSIARAIGRPTAYRAVGGAIGANPIPLIVPCHRVLGGDGRITGYSAGSGIITKAWLLDHEGIGHA